ncbi:shikimate kinase [Lacrimispora xylanisolvens]|jgi:adenylate kinase family enzyme|uniref:Shikimate kinase n=1 Tax=Lacrimispora xylanisolvens TaxID=384636 RepID=A0A2S6HNH2_9FIRM|nr:AAA family ATPase [Hungatella xylanolytica]PPK79030.1 shikimate kinase [Hungatella xylanolytica]
MIQGIAVFGLNGGGKSTLTHALAKQIGYFEMDVEDYYFPQQRESRKWALENRSVIENDQSDELPFSNPRTKSEVQTAILENIKIHPRFIISGVTMNWCDEILSSIDIAFWVQTPLEERLKRIQAREEKRFGARVLDGGDMYEQQMEFREMVKNRNLNEVEECTTKLGCPVIVIDGTLSVIHNLENIINNLR